VISLVLVRPGNAENLGAAARAMRNFGLVEWTWVDSQVQDLGPARRLAVHAVDLVDQAQHASSLDEAVADAIWVVGTSSRHVPGRPRLNPRAAARELVARSAQGRVGLVFGDERNGLTNAEIQRCHALSGAPTLEPQPSINLAQAVLLYCYELRVAQLEAAPQAHIQHTAPATHAELTSLQQCLHGVLEQSRFLVHAERHALRDLVAPLVRGQPTRREVRLWMAVLHTLLRRLDKSQ
jgi:TrmH family RNA methyltransferase